MQKKVLGGFIAIVVILALMFFVNPGLFTYLKNQFLIFTGSFTLEEELKPAFFLAPYNGGLYTSRGKNITESYLPGAAFVLDAARTGEQVALITYLPEPDKRYGVWVNGVLKTESEAKKESIDISPDGTRVAYVEYDVANPVIVIMTGEESTRLSGASHPIFLSNTLLLVTNISGVGFYDLTKPEEGIRQAGLESTTVSEAAAPDRGMVAVIHRDKSQATVYWSVDQTQGLLMPRMTIPYLSGSSIALTSHAAYVLAPADSESKRTLLKYSYGGEVTQLRTYDRSMYLTELLP